MSEKLPFGHPDAPEMRKCGLCGQPILKHIVPGEKHREWAGSLGLICPTDARLTEPQSAAELG
jgi:hypothetical protein